MILLHDDPCNANKQVDMHHICKMTNYLDIALGPPMIKDPLILEFSSAHGQGLPDNDPCPAQIGMDLGCICRRMSYN